MVRQEGGGLVQYVNFAVFWRQTPLGGASGTREVQLKAFAKENGPGHPFVVANEFVASRLGHRMGLPLPPGTMIEAEDPAQQPAWVTVAFSKDVPPPVDPALVVREEPELAAGVLVFDLLIANFDRHAGNLRFKHDRLDVFDHSHSLFGVNGRAQDNLKALRETFVLDGPALWGQQWNRHCLLDHLTNANHILNWADEVNYQLKERFLRQVCEEVVGLGLGIDEPDGEALFLFLSYRRDKLKKLIKDNQAEFTSVSPTTWGLGI